MIFSKGGYGALPVVVAARWYRIPLFVHESDAIPGKTNLFAGRFARRIAVAFRQALPFFPAEKTAVVGNPIRNVFSTPPPKAEALASFKLDVGKKTVLIIGGSQGAKALNDIVLDVLPELLKRFQVIHQCGARNFGDVKKEADFMLRGLEEENARRYRLYGFLDAEELAAAYGAADVAVSRAGAGSIFELAACGIPAILIPLSHAAQDHQRANAYAYAETGAAVVLEEANMTPHIFVREITSILDDEERRANMQAAARAFARPDAARLIAAELLRSVGIAV
jgi:UDP-N-acetylglucosamine--N-acetylmuramyl-(pentapeptide) pyrophosphoryl-undecaprenol N-acetylglucosamine transferase